MYAFKTIEAALSRFHRGAKSGAFRGRLKNFQRIGLVPSSPGRGKRIEYSYEDACMWAFALQIGEYGIDPTAIRAIVDFTWPAVFPLYQRGNHGQVEFFVMHPAAIASENAWQHFNYSVGPAHRAIPDPEGDWSRLIVIKVTPNSMALRQALGVGLNVDLAPSDWDKNRVATVKETITGFWPNAYADSEPTEE